MGPRSDVGAVRTMRTRTGSLPTLGLTFMALASVPTTATAAPAVAWVGDVGGGDLGSWIDWILDTVEKASAPGEAARVCFPHNPDALTNACMVVAKEQRSETFTHPGASADPTLDASWTCVYPIGNVCVPVLVPYADPGLAIGDGSSTVHYLVPGASGYAEVTLLCAPLGEACRASLP